MNRACFLSSFCASFFPSFFPLPTVPFLPQSPPSSDLKTPPFPRGNAIFRGWGAARVLEGVTPQKKEGISLKNGAQPYSAQKQLQHLLVVRADITKGVHSMMRLSKPHGGPMTWWHLASTVLMMTISCKGDVLEGMTMLAYMDGSPYWPVTGDGDAQEGTNMSVCLCEGLSHMNLSITGDDGDMVMRIYMQDCIPLRP